MSFLLSLFNDFTILSTIVAIIIVTLIILFLSQETKKVKKKEQKVEKVEKGVEIVKKEERNNERIQTAIIKDEWRSFKLIDKQILSHDVRLFRFELPKDTILGLPIGQHISFRYLDEEGKEVIRSYTPTNADETNGHLDFCVKIYFKNQNPKFPNGGKMSQHLNDLNLGDYMLMRGPKGNITYHNDGHFTIIKNTIEHNIKPKKLGLIAGGTGITPMLQLLNTIVHSHLRDDIDISLIFANQTEEDIFLRSYLEEYPHNKIHIWYTIDRSIKPEEWKYSIGFVNSTMIQEHLPSPSKDTLILVCGPLPMIKFACEPALKELGFDDEHWFAF